MKLTKTVQIAILLCLYLSRAGRAKMPDVASNFDISLHFLLQIAHKLKNAGVIQSSRGPGGGYSLREDATINDVLKVFGLDRPLESTEADLYKLGTPEERALAAFSRSLAQAALVATNRKITNVMNDLVANEVARLNKIDETGVSH